MDIHTFPTGAVLSVVTGKLISENHMDGLYEILNWMTGESLHTHQLPRVAEEAKTVILARHPDLQQAIDEATEVNQNNCWSWLAVWKARYGDVIEVPKLIAQHERIDALSELTENVHPDRVIVVVSK